MRAGVKKVMILQDARARRQEREIQEKNGEVQFHKQQNESRHINGSCLPPLSGQSLQSHPPAPGPRHMFHSELPNKGLRHGPVQQKPTVGANHHTLLTPGEHDVRPPLVHHKPRRRGPDYRDDDVVPFISLKRVDVEYGVFPGEVCCFQRGLDRVPLGVVGGDDLEFLPFSHVTTDYLRDGPDFSFVLSGRWVSATHDGFVFWRGRRTTQLSPFLVSSPSLTSTKRQQATVRMGCVVPSFESYT